MTIQSYISPTFFDAKIQTLNTALSGLSIVDIYPLCQVGISEGETFPECYRNDGLRVSERIYPEGTCLSFFLLNGDITTQEDDYDFNVPLSLFVWADLSKISKTASGLIQEVAKRLKSNSCNDLTIQTENVFSEFSDLEKQRFQNVMYPYFAFRVDFTCMLQICVNQRAGIDLPPVLQSIILTSPNTLRITYDKALNESIIPALGDYVFEWLTREDLDGNLYSTVEINGQLWLTSNLKVTKYADGSAIPNITDQTQWNNDTVGAYCWYNNDITNKSNYGAAYNAYAVNNVAGLAYIKHNGVLEAGWRVPTQTDFDNLVTFAGGSLVAGGKLKTVGQDYWGAFETINLGTNDYNFSLRGAGARDVSFTYLNYMGSLWSSTLKSGTPLNAQWFMRVFSDEVSVAVTYQFKKVGNSIRLVKDL